MRAKGVDTYFAYHESLTLLPIDADKAAKPVSNEGASP